VSPTGFSTLAALTLDQAGSYTFAATVSLFNATGGNVTTTCKLLLGGIELGETTVRTSESASMYNADVSLLGAGSISDAPQSASLQCTTSANFTIQSNPTLIATKVGTLHTN
jgi:hypothetical protein